MKREEVVRRLHEWQDAMRDMEGALDGLRTLTGCEPESPLVSGVLALQGLATRQTAELIGTAPEWLETWWLEHNFGERPLRAGLVGEPLRTISTLEELVALIVEDCEGAQP